ncbi:unnamed protein product [Closterium sp. Naga37s-1]|nr:unnamed protein product [Closterium sp. Naga37s-1]
MAITGSCAPLAALVPLFLLLLLLVPESAWIGGVVRVGHALDASNVVGDMGLERGMSLLRQWENAYGLKPEQRLPPDVVSLPPNVPRAPHLEECVARTARRREAEQRGANGESPGERQSCFDANEAPPPPSRLSFLPIHLPPPSSPSPPLPPPLLPLPPRAQVRGAEAENLAKTRVVQRDIWERQFPPGDCQGQRLLVLPWSTQEMRGVGSGVSGEGTGVCCGAMRHVPCHPIHVILLFPSHTLPSAFFSLFPPLFSPHLPFVPSAPHFLRLIPTFYSPNTLPPLSSPPLRSSTLRRHALTPRSPPQIHVTGLFLSLSMALNRTLVPYPDSYHHANTSDCIGTPSCWEHCAPCAMGMNMERAMRHAHASRPCVTPMPHAFQSVQNVIQPQAATARGSASSRPWSSGHNSSWECFFAPMVSPACDALVRRLMETAEGAGVKECASVDYDGLATLNDTVVCVSPLRVDRLKLESRATRWGESRGKMRRSAKEREQRGNRDGGVCVCVSALHVDWVKLEWNPGQPGGEARVGRERMGRERMGRGRMGRGERRGREWGGENGVGPHLDRLDMVEYMGGMEQDDDFKMLETDMVECMGGMEQDDDFKMLEVRWWRAQATRFMLRWPSAYLCHVTNRVRHSAYGLHAAMHLSRFEEERAEILRLVAAGDPVRFFVKDTDGKADLDGAAKAQAKALAELKFGGSTLEGQVWPAKGMESCAFDCGPNGEGRWKRKEVQGMLQGVGGEVYAPRPMVSVHVRQSDKFKEMTLLSFAMHMFFAQRLRAAVPDLKHVWLNTEMEVRWREGVGVGEREGRGAWKGRLGKGRGSVMEQTKQYPSWQPHYSTNPCLPARPHITSLPFPLLPLSTPFPPLPPPAPTSPADEASVIEQTKQYPSWQFHYSTNPRLPPGANDTRAYEFMQDVAVSLASVLIAAECDYFVGSLESNWSRLINELRSTNGRLYAGFIALNIGLW